MKIHLPYPVSVNAMYRNLRGKGRVKSTKYKVWCNFAISAYFAYCAKRPTIKRVLGKVFIHITVRRPDKRKRDIDNLAKGILDFLVKQCIIDDDHNVEKLVLEWVYEGPEGATITIEKI